MSKSEMQQGDAAWLAARDKCAITWSAAGEALGLGYKSRIAYMKRKLQLVPPPAQNWRMTEGIRREPWVCELYYRLMRESGIDIEFRTDAFRVDWQNAALGGSVDRLVRYGNREWIFEAKTCPDGDMREEIPITHLIQMHGLCHTYRAPFAHYLCWSQSQGMLLAEVHFAPELWDVLYPLYEEFIALWNAGKLPEKMTKDEKEWLERKVRSLCDIREIDAVRTMLDIKASNTLRAQ